MTRDRAANPAPLLPLLLLLSACAVGDGRGPAHTALTGACELPCELRQGLFLVRGRLNGQVHEFLLDTGTDRMVLDVGLGRTLDLERDRGGRVRSAAGIELAHHGTVVLEQLQLGDVTFTDVPASLLDLQQLSSTTGRPIAGILGCDLFTGCEVEIDYPARRVTLRPRTEEPRPGGIAYTGSIPTVGAMLDGKPMDVLIDTGFQRLLALPPDAALTWRRPPRPDGEFVTVAGSAAKWLGRLRGALHLGEHRWQDPWVTVAPGSAKIGAQALRDLVLTLDAAAGRIWLLRR